MRQCLSFLSALVAQGPEAAREVLSNIHAYKALSGLAKRKDKQVRVNLPVSYPNYILLNQYLITLIGQTRCPHGLYPVCAVLFGFWRQCHHWTDIGNKR